MRKKKIKFVGWFSYKDVDEIFTTLAEIPNLKNNPIFHEAPFDDAHKDAIIKELVENGYIICGDTHQAENHSCIPVFEDGYIFLSMRAWGALMAEAKAPSLVESMPSPHVMLDRVLVPSVSTRRSPAKI